MKKAARLAWAKHRRELALQQNQAARPSAVNAPMPRSADLAEIARALQRSGLVVVRR